MTNLEAAMRTAHRNHPAAFRAALRGLDLLAEDGRIKPPSRFRAALKKRFPTSHQRSAPTAFSLRLGQR
jgi:hypothetical protein